MRKLICLMGLALMLVLGACKKDKNYTVTGTVTQQTSCEPNALLVIIDNPNHSRHGFLCDPMSAMLSSSSNNCGNSVYIRVPANLARAGQKIKFSGWTDEGVLCSVGTFGAHHIKVKNISAN